MKPADPERDKVLDDVLAKIDADLPKIHQLCRTTRKRRKMESDRLPAVNGAAPPTPSPTTKVPTPAQGFRPSKLKKTRMAFQSMAAAPLLTESGDDLLAHSSDAERPLVQQRRKA